MAYQPLTEDEIDELERAVKWLNSTWGGKAEFRLVETVGIYYIFPEFPEVEDGKEKK